MILLFTTSLKKSIQFYEIVIIRPWL